MGILYSGFLLWIWKCKHGNRIKDKEAKQLYRYLKHGRRHRKRGNRRDNRGTIPNRVSIEQRPKIVNRRKRIGDIEVDLMIGKNHQSALLVSLDRATLHTQLRLLKSKNSYAVKETLKNLYKGDWVKTFTFDNDQAFTNHQGIINKYSEKTFFTKPNTHRIKAQLKNESVRLNDSYPRKPTLIKSRINKYSVSKLKSITDQSENLNTKHLIKSSQKKLHLLVELTPCITEVC